MYDLFDTLRYKVDDLITKSNIYDLKEFMYALKQYADYLNHQIDVIESRRKEMSQSDLRYSFYTRCCNTWLNDYMQEQEYVTLKNQALALERAAKYATIRCNGLGISMSPLSLL